MELKLYRTPGEFLEENREFLLEYEAAAQLNLGNAQAYREEKCHPGLLFGRCEEEGRGVLLFGNTAPWNLCLNAIPGDPAALSASVFLAEHLRENNVTINGINAAKSLCDPFSFAYGGNFHLRTAMDIMVLRELVEPPVMPGRLRKAGPGDLELLVDWTMAFTWEAVGETPDRQKKRERMVSLSEGNAAYLFETPEGVPVSMACTTRKLPHGVCISYVYTPPEFRGQGYCQNTVAGICREKLGEGNGYCTLFVDKKNPISNRVYEKIGFTVLEDNFDYRLEQ